MMEDGGWKGRRGRRANWTQRRRAAADGKIMDGKIIGMEGSWRMDVGFGLVWREGNDIVRLDGS